MRRLNVFLFCLLFSQLASYAQFYQHSYGDQPRTELGLSIIRANEFPDELVMAGEVNNAVWGRYDATLIKTDLNGSIIWSKVYGDSKNDHFNCVRGDVPHDDIAYVALGKAETSVFGGHEVYLVGTDYNGNQLFGCVYGGPEYDEGKCIQVVKTPLSPDGVGLIMVGVTKSFSGKLDIYVILTDIKGNLIRSTIITGHRDMGGNWIEQTGNGEFVLTGFCYDNYGNKMVYAARLKPDLNIIWANRHYIAPYKEAEAFCIKEDPKSDLILTGYNNNGGDEDVFLMKLDRNGYFMDLRTYHYGVFERGHNLMIEKDAYGDIYYTVSGRIDRTIGAFNEMDGLLFKTKVNFSPIWAHRYGLDDMEESFEICKGIEDGYFFTGRVNSFGFGNHDVYLVSTDRYGFSHTECDKEIDFRLGERPVDPAAYGDQVFVPWFKEYMKKEEKLDYPMDKCHFKSSEKLEIENSNTVSNGELKVFPSPASNSVTVKLNDEFVGGSIYLYNAMGKLITKISADNIQKEIDLNGLANGMYILKIENQSNYKTIRFQKQ